MTKENKVYILYGLPGSGKTTWVQKNKKDCVIISRDSLRYMIYGEYNFIQDDELMISNMAFECIKEAISNYKNIILDETNLNPIRRYQYTDLFKSSSYETILVDFSEINIDICKQRRLKDNKGINQDWNKIIDTMKNGLRPIDTSFEKYDKIIKIKE